ncbi:MAG: AraC family transcriptional regulator [Burkholderiales bacterium]|nr:AraC family transcriptional regulator [Burkholderiales bacterium]
MLLRVALAALLLAGIGAARSAEPPLPAAATSASSTSASSTSASSTSASSTSAHAAPASAPAGSLDERIQALKSDVIALNRDLMVLEEELLFPPGTQVAIFVSMDVGKLFALDSVQITLDDKPVANHLYTPREVEALHRGGVQRLYLGNLRSGEHRLVALFTGRGPHERDYRRGATLSFDKRTEPKYIELRIEDSMARLQPEFRVKVWQ